jgi:hypothetical protein
MRRAISLFLATCFWVYSLPAQIAGPHRKIFSAATGGAAPTISSYTQTTWTTAGTVSGSNYIKTVTVSWQASDIVVLMAGSEGSGSEGFMVPTATGLTFTCPVNHAASSNPALAVCTATAGSAGTSVTVTDGISSGSGSTHFGFGVWVMHGSTGVGNVSSQFTATRTVALTPAGGTHSAILWAVMDWASAAAQSGTPTPTNNRNATQDGSNYTSYTFDLADQAGTGSVSYGIGGSGTGPFSMAVLEVKHQ